MALVEAIVGEFQDQFEDGIGGGFLDAVGGGAGAEIGLLRHHFGVNLLAHGAAQQIGLTQTIAGQFPRQAHHLFLIDDDAIGFAQDRLHRRVQQFHLLAARLAQGKAWDVVHRARAVESAQRDDIGEAIGAHLRERAAHAFRFKLEHAHRVAFSDQLVHGRIVHGQRGPFHLNATGAQHGGSAVEHRERFQAEEVELHQTGLFRRLHLELCHRHV